MQNLSNQELSISMNSFGAELSSVKNKKTNFEFIWQADQAIWARHSPNLFPFVGKLNNNRILIHKKYYPMTQHGFARDYFFQVKQKTNESILYSLVSSAETLKLYPYEFEFCVEYVLLKNELKVEYSVKNNSSETMYFSLGAHPGFQLPAKNLSEFEIDFHSMNEIEREFLVNGFYDGSKETIRLNNGKLKLDVSLFDTDAIVIKGCKTKNITLSHINSDYKIEMSFNDFKDIGIWTKKGCQEFVCIEPWLGYADNVGFNEDISKKSGIEQCAQGEVFKAKYLIKFP